MNEYFNYTAKDEQRWDQISYELYGSAFQYGDLIALNPQYAQLAILPGGTVLQVPTTITTSNPAIDTSQLPPWKR